MKCVAKPFSFSESNQDLQVPIAVLDHPSNY